MLQNLLAFAVIVATVSGFFYWLIRSNQKLIAKDYEDELARSEGIKRANKAADEVLAEPLGTESEWLADQRRMHDERHRRETEEG
jgi:hypothetical protein